MPNSNIPVTGGNVHTYQVGAAGPHRQYLIPGNHGGFEARFTTYRMPGRAGTTGQNLAAVFNAAGSTVLVDVDFVGVDLVQTVVKAVTVEPPIVRLLKLTTIPTGGTAGFKVPDDSSLTTNASVTTYQDASAENTVSGTALAFTQTTAASGITQEFAPRYMGGAGTNPLYEPADRLEFLNHPVTLRAGEGLGIRLEYNLATMNPATDKWVATIHWEEYAA